MVVDLGGALDIGQVGVVLGITLDVTVVGIALNRQGIVLANRDYAA